MNDAQVFTSSTPPSVFGDPAKNLRFLLIGTALMSIVHYADNIARWALYPEPAWDNARLTDGFWFLMAPAGLAAYALARRGEVRRALPATYLYGAMNLVVLGHYLYARPWDITLLVNVTILGEAAMAVWLVAYASRHLTRARWTSREGLERDSRNRRDAMQP